MLEPYHLDYLRGTEEALEQIGVVGVLHWRGIAIEHHQKGQGSLDHELETDRLVDPGFHSEVSKWI